MTPRQFVAAWLGRKKIRIDERGTLVSPNIKDTYYQIFDALWLDYNEQMHVAALETGKKQHTCRESDMKKALDELIKNELAAQLAKIVANTKCTEGENLKPLSAYIEALTGKSEPLVLGVLAHWLWQVKRKLMGMEVVYQIMPILYGPQGAGKSVALQKLLSPIANLTLELSLTEVTDARFYFSFNTNYAAILDEMAGARRADVEALKKQITANYNDARKLGTNDVVKIKQNVSLIGTTNRPVGELIYDTTGARRFFQVDILPKADWKKINEIDYLELFRGVDENRARGYIEEHLTELSKAQEQLTGQDEITAFFDQHQINPTSDNTKEIPCSEFYSVYTTWCEANGITRPDNSLWFGKRLKQRGIKGIAKTTGGKTVRMYLINKDATVHAKTTFDSLEAIPRIGKLEV